MQVLLRAGIVFCGMLTFCQVADADVIYQFTGTFLSGPYAGQPFTPSIEVTDAAVAAGSMQFSMSGGQLGCGPNSPPLPQHCTITGDPSGFVSLSGSSWSPSTFSGFGTNIAVDLTFNPNGTLAGSITDHDFNEDLQISGDANGWSGRFAADFYMQCSFSGTGNACPVQGDFAEVPEPLSISMVATGLAGVVMRRRKRSQRSDTVCS